MNKPEPSSSRPEPLLPNPEEMEPEERLAYINDVRSRMLEDPDNVTEEEIKHSLRLLALDRSGRAAASQASRAKKAPAQPIADDFF